MANAQLSMAYPHLVPGETVRWSSRGSWHFGLLVGIDGTHAVVTTRDGGRRERFPASGVEPWPRSASSE